jgi:hypothetical protein
MMSLEEKKSKYKIYVYDKRAQTSYPIMVQKESIIELAKWLNTYITRWHVTVVRGEWIDKSNNYLGEIKFLPHEIVFQKFATTYPERLLMHYKEYGDEVVI